MIDDWRSPPVRLADRAIAKHGALDDSLEGELARLRAFRWLRQRLPLHTPEQLDAALDIAWEGPAR